MKKSDEFNLRLTIIGCFRYSLGRMTYMPSHTVEIIKQHQKIFTRNDWERFIKEIDECDNLGMECDKQTWKELKKFANEKIKEVVNITRFTTCDRCLAIDKSPEWELKRIIIEKGKSRSTFDLCPACSGLLNSWLVNKNGRVLK